MVIRHIVMQGKEVTQIAPTIKVERGSKMFTVDVKFLEELGERIANARREAGMTQTELGEQLGCSQAQVASYESGRRRLPVSILPQLSALIEVSVQELLGQDDKKKSKKRGPPAKLQRQLEELQQLPRAKQKLVIEMLDGILANKSA